MNEELNCQLFEPYKIFARIKCRNKVLYISGSQPVGRRPLVGFKGGVKEQKEK